MILTRWGLSSCLRLHNQYNTTESRAKPSGNYLLDKEHDLTPVSNPRMWVFGDNSKTSYKANHCNGEWPTWSNIFRVWGHQLVCVLSTLEQIPLHDCKRLENPSQSAWLDTQTLRSFHLWTTITNGRSKHLNVPGLVKYPLWINAFFSYIIYENTFTGKYWNHMLDFQGSLWNICVSICLRNQIISRHCCNFLHFHSVRTYTGNFLSLIFSQDMWISISYSCLISNSRDTIFRIWIYM